MASYNNCLPEGLSKSPTIQKVTGLTKESSAIITKKKKDKFESKGKESFIFSSFGGKLQHTCKDFKKSKIP